MQQPEPTIGEIMRDAGLPTELPPTMARGVDLSIVRAKRSHPHRFCVIARYIVDDDQLTMIQEQIDAANAEMAAAKLRGEPPSQTGVNISVPLESVYLLGVEGPGCQKCGLHMTAEKGHGHLCEKSDDEFPELADLYYAKEQQLKATREAAEGAVDATDA